MKNKYQDIIRFIRKTYNEPTEAIPLHSPVFIGNEKKYLNECIETTFVSSVGKFVDEFERMTANYIGSKYAVAAVNGTAALHIALLLAGVKRDDEVITQSLTFIATANAIKMASASPIFIDVDKDTMGLSPEKLEHWLRNNTRQQTNKATGEQETINKITNKRLSSIVPMHTFGHPCRIEEIISVANKYNIPVIEDSAESLGSLYKGRHTGTFGKIGVFSYNGNKTITTGGGGMIVTDDQAIAKRAKHITTTAKIPHPYEYIHDEMGFNYRLTNINAALGVAQMEKIDDFLLNKRETAKKYKSFFYNQEINFMAEPRNTKANYWLNAICLQDLTERDDFLKETNKNGIMTRPIWQLMNKLDMFNKCQTDDLANSLWLSERIINIPSSVRLK